MSTLPVNQNHLSTTLHYLFRHPYTSRVEIASKTKMTKALVTHAIAHLQSLGYVIETGQEERKKKGSGKARKLICLNPNAACSIGIEFNMEQICALRCSLNGEVEQMIRKPIHSIDLEKLSEIISEMINTLFNESRTPVLGVGLAIPGHYDQDQDSIVTNNPAWKHFSLKKIQDQLIEPLPMSIENNVECMSYGRYLFRSESSPDEFILLHIGPGLYCSFFDSALTERKKSNYFGEIGHSVVDINGILCECGKKGCLQTYISNNWLNQRARIYLENGASPVLRNLVRKADDLNVEILQKAYLQNDPFIRNILEDGISRLAITLSNLLIVHDAKRIFINSQLLQESELEAYFRRRIMEQFSFILGLDSIPVEILPFRYDRGAQGACALVFYDQLIQHPDHALC